jgi:hypothetical protein
VIFARVIAGFFFGRRSKLSRAISVQSHMNDDDHVPSPPPAGLASLLGDLKDPRLMYVKAILFLIAGLLCVAALFIQNPTPTTALLLGIGIWSFCRLYYFAFYVIEKYIDSSFKFAGLHSVVLYLLRKRLNRSKPPIE